MNQSNYITIPEKRNRGQHLGAEERGAIQELKKQGYSNRAIAQQLNCNPSTIGYELKRGTPTYKGHGRKPSYSAKRGGAVYKANCSACHRPMTIQPDSAFIKWTVKQLREHKWSLDACVGYARRKNLFSEEKIPCTKTIYNMVWKGRLPLSLFELPEALSRRKRGIPRLSKRINGRSLEERPAEVAERSTFGHWESDTVQGRKKKDEPTIFTIVERLTGCYLSIRINGKTSNGIADAMEQLHAGRGEREHHQCV